MLTLCLDTSGGSAVALVRDDAGAPAVLAEAAGPDPRRHAETLAPLVEQVLAEADLTRHDLDAVAVGTGPAPFTGLRVGLVTARALAHGLHIPVHGASSLDLLARQALDRLDEEDLEVLVVTDARRKEVYWARYRALGADDVLRVSGPEVASPAAVATQLLSDADAEVRVLGAGTELYADHLPPTPGLPARPDPAVLRRLVRTRLARAVAGDAVELGTEPLYLRRPDVQTPGAPKRATEQRA